MHSDIRVQRVNINAKFRAIVSKYLINWDGFEVTHIKEHSGLLVSALDSGLSNPCSSKPCHSLWHFSWQWNAKDTLMEPGGVRNSSCFCFLFIFSQFFFRCEWAKLWWTRSKRKEATTPAMYLDKHLTSYVRNLFNKWWQETIETILGFYCFCVLLHFVIIPNIHVTHKHVNCNVLNFYNF